MPPWKALLLSVPLALAGSWAALDAGARLERLRRQMDELATAGRTEGDSYMKTLKGEHADRQLEHFDRRRELALELAHARRDQLLGILAVVGGALVFAGAALARRIGAEVEEERRRQRTP